MRQNAPPTAFPSYRHWPSEIAATVNYDMGDICPAEPVKSLPQSDLAVRAISRSQFDKEIAAVAAELSDYPKTPSPGGRGLG